MKAEINIKKFNVKQLAERMVRRGINQAELSRRMKLSGSSINYWMQGKKVPHVKRMGKLAKVLGVKVDYFFVPDAQHAS